MIDFLMRLQFIKHLDWNSTISPFYIPIFDIFLDEKIVVQIKANLFDYLILCIDEIGSDGFRFAFMWFIDGGILDVLIFAVWVFSIVFH